MKILFDYQAFEMQKVGGVSRSYAELISHLRINDGYKCELGLKESDNVHLKECGVFEGIKPLRYMHNRLFEGKKLFKGQRTITRKLIRLFGYTDDCWQLNKDYCVKLLKKQRFDIFEPTFFDSYFLPYLKGKPFVLTVHDMIPEIMGVDKLQMEQKKLLCPLAAHIHVPSQNTKSDLVRVLGISPEKITVVPHGVHRVSSIKYNSLFDFPYLLYVGGRWLYKKFSSFVEECNIVMARHSDIRVVCTGLPFEKEELQLINQYGLGQHFINVYASEQEMQALYQNAVAFVYPSAYEGFGMPILEAFVNKCPVLLNNASCFPEIGGNAALYFDIDKRGELADQLEVLLVSDSIQENMRKKGLQQAELFSWTTSAMQIKKVYEKVCGR